jgi:ABC-type antimicrobial peptide transport system permease subunit
MLTAVGLYGLLTNAVARRTNEIGICLALGLERREVLWMVIRHVLVLLFMGVAIGLTMAWGASRFVSSVLFGVKGTDPLTFGAASAHAHVRWLGLRLDFYRRGGHRESISW